MPRLFDLTIFGQLETEILAVRLAVLCPYVHRGFIGVSIATMSGSGRTPLPSNLAQRVAQWCPQYQLVWANHSVSDGNSWGSRQWDAVKRAYASMGGNELDVGIVTEHDEIPMPQLLVRPPAEDALLDTQYFYYYRAECKSVRAWNLGLLLRGSSLLARGSLDGLRRSSRAQGFPRVLDRSWHLSTFMGPREVVNKLRQAQHTECDRAPFSRVNFQRVAQAECLQFCGSERLVLVSTVDPLAYPPPLCQFPRLASAPWCELHRPTPRSRETWRAGEPSLPQDQPPVEQARPGEQLAAEQPAAARPSPRCASVLLERRTSKSECTLGLTFGCADTSRGAHMWVAGGCRGFFRCGVATDVLVRSVVTTASEPARLKCGFPHQDHRRSYCKCDPTGRRQWLMQHYDRYAGAAEASY